MSEVATKLQAGGLTIPGALDVKGGIKTPSGHTFSCEGRQHMTGGEHLYILHKNGVVIGKEWGGNGNLYVQGNLEVNGSFNLLPRGVIVAWSNATPPAGWALCDGANGTPDLRGRFIRMASSDLTNEAGAPAGWFDGVVGRKSNSGNIPASVVGNSRDDSSSRIFKMNIGEYGGTDHMTLSNAEIPPHKHFTADANPTGSHFWNHNGKYLGNDNRDFSGGGGAAFGTTNNPNRAFTTGNGNVESGLNGWGHNNMPPYYVLTYIMKL